MRKLGVVLVTVMCGGVAAAFGCSESSTDGAKSASGEPAIRLRTAELLADASPPTGDPFYDFGQLVKKKALEQSLKLDGFPDDTADAGDGGSDAGPTGTCRCPTSTCAYDGDVCKATVSTRSAAAATEAQCAALRVENTKCKVGRLNCGQDTAGTINCYATTAGQCVFDSYTCDDVVLGADETCAELGPNVHRALPCDSSSDGTTPLPPCAQRTQERHTACSGKPNQNQDGCTAQTDRTNTSACTWVPNGAPMPMPPH